MLWHALMGHHRAAILSFGGAVVTSTSQRRMASTSPIRADVASMTSTIWPSWLSGFGPHVPRVCSQTLITARIALTCAGLRASGVRLGLCSREMLSTGLRISTSWRTASPNASRNTVLARLADE